MDGMPEKLRAAGFGNCSERPAWGYMSQAAACAFEPSRFEAQAIPLKREQPAPCDLPEEINFG
jgi:hypothetical protein